MTKSKQCHGIDFFPQTYNIYSHRANQLDGRTTIKDDEKVKDLYLAEFGQFSLQVVDDVDFQGIYTPRSARYQLTQSPRCTKYIDFSTRLCPLE